MNLRPQTNRYHRIDKEKRPSFSSGAPRRVAAVFGWLRSGRLSSRALGAPITVVFFIVAVASATTTEAEVSQVGRGEQYFRACAGCHSLTPDHNMTGPSLAGVFGRKAGALSSFQRYSPALKSSSVVWDEGTLDAWLAEPDAFIPGSRMTFEGIKPGNIRADIIAYLKSAMTSAQAQLGPKVGAPGDPDLKKLDPENKVLSITYCPDTYRVTTADGQTQEFWERNLRFKTDSSAIGPDKGAPALFGAGMQGDRASVIFSAPEEIGLFVKRECQDGATGR